MKEQIILPEFNESLSRKMIWHIAKIPIVAVVLLLIIAAGPWFSGVADVYGCTCPACEFANWYNNIGGIERLWFNLRAIIQSF